MSRGRISKVCLLALSGLLAGCAGLEETEETEQVDTEQIESGSITTSSTCFSVQVPGSYTIKGTLVSPSSFSRAVLLVHGAAGSRDAMLGPAFYLAARGYGVFVIDRLGYGQSPYVGSGFELSLDTHVEATHQILQKIRAGAYRCDGGAGIAASSVFLGGQSLSAAIVEVYATRHNDVDGIISTGYSTFGPGQALLQQFGAHILPQINAGADYFTLFAYPNGVSPECVAGMFYAPGASSTIYNAICSQNAPGTVIDGLTPSGDTLSSLGSGAEIQANTGNVDAPILFVQADRDAFAPGAGGGPSGTEPNTQALEADHWRNTCNCEVSVTTRGTSAGHLWQFHYQALGLLDEVADWLDSN